MPGQAKTDTSQNGPVDRRALIGLLVGATLARTAAVVAMRGSLALDVDNYRELAENLTRSGVYGIGGAPTAYRPPLYPLLLATLDFVGQLNLATIAALHVALGVATVWLVAALGKQWGLQRWRFLAAGLVALDPILLRQSSVVMTETLATFLAAAGLTALTTLATRPSVLRAFFTGAVLAAGVLCRPVFLLWLAIAPVALLGLLPNWSARARSIGCLVVAAALVLLPWMIRNQLQFGRPIVTTTHGGFTALLANNPEFYAHLRATSDTPWDSADFNQRVAAERVAEPADEVATDRREGAEAWRNIQNEPAPFGRAVVFRLSRLWGVLPMALPGESESARALRYATGVWYAAEFILALWGAASQGWQLLRSPWVFGVLLAGSLTAAHAVYWTDLRMRAPAAPVIALLAAAGASWLVRKMTDRNSLSSK